VSSPTSRRGSSELLALLPQRWHPILIKEVLMDDREGKREEPINIDRAQLEKLGALFTKWRKDREALQRLKAMMSNPLGDEK